MLVVAVAVCVEFRYDTHQVWICRRCFKYDGVYPRALFQAQAQVQDSSLIKSIEFPQFQPLLIGDFELGDLAVSIGLCGLCSGVAPTPSIRTGPLTSTDLLELKRKHVGRHFLPSSSWPEHLFN